MEKSKFIKQMTEYGDAVVTYTSPVSRKSKYVVATTDFMSSPHIQRRKQPSKRVTEGNSLLLFCWDTDTFKHIDIDSVERIEPLNRIISRGSTDGTARVGRRY